MLKKLNIHQVRQMAKLTMHIFYFHKCSCSTDIYKLELFVKNHLGM